MRKANNVKQTVFVTHYIDRIEVVRDDCWEMRLTLDRAEKVVTLLVEDDAIKVGGVRVCIPAQEKAYTVASIKKCIRAIKANNERLERAQAFNR